MQFKWKGEGAGNCGLGYHPFKRRFNLNKKAKEVEGGD